MFKSTVVKIISSVVGGVLTAVIVYFLMGSGNGLSKEERNKKIFATLESYSKDVNNKRFDAYKYFTRKIERYYLMLDTSPKKINDYVNDLFYNQFQNSNMHFDENTLSVNEINQEEFDVSVIMYSTYYKVQEKKQYTDFRTRIELKFDNNFRIKYFKQLYD